MIPLWVPVMFGGMTIAFLMLGLFFAGKARKDIVCRLFHKRMWRKEWHVVGFLGRKAGFWVCPKCGDERGLVRPLEIQDGE